MSQAELEAVIKFIQQQGRVFSIINKPISLLLVKEDPVTWTLAQRNFSQDVVVKDSRHP